MSCSLFRRRRQPGVRTLYARHAQAGQPDVGVAGSRCKHLGRVPHPHLSRAGYMLLGACRQRFTACLQSYLEPPARGRHTPLLLLARARALSDSERASALSTVHANQMRIQNSISTSFSRCGVTVVTDDARRRQT